MMTLITGGSGSGKSAYAEDYLLSLAKEEKKYYIATMQIYDAEGERKDASSGSAQRERFSDDRSAT